MGTGALAIQFLIRNHEKKRNIRPLAWRLDYGELLPLLIRTPYSFLYKYWKMIGLLPLMFSPITSK